MNTAYGIDVSSGSVTVVRAVRKRKSTSCEMVYDGPSDTANPSFTEARTRAVAEFAQGKATIAACVPVSSSTVRWLKTPFASVSKSRQVLPSLLDIQLPFPLEKCAHVFPMIVPEDGRVRALAVAVQRESLESRIEECRSLFAAPVVLDHEGLAIWSQSHAEKPLDPGTLRVTACVRPDRIVLVLGRAEALMSAHSCLLPEANAPEAFAARVHRILHADLQGESGSAVEWVWTGPGADDKAAIALFEEHLKSERIASFDTHENNVSFLARAVAGRSLSTAVPCDLRTGEHVHEQTIQWRRRRSLRFAGAYAAAGILICLLNLAWVRVLENHESRLQESLTEAARDIYGPGVQYGQEVRMAREAVADKVALRAPFTRAFGESPSRTLAACMEVAAAAGLEFETLTVRSDALALKGTADDWDHCEQIKTLAVKLGYEPKLDREDAGADERVHFNFRGGRI